VADQKYLIKGVYSKTGEDRIRVTELPVGTWTMPYTTFLEGLMDGTATDKQGKKIPPQIRDFTSICTEVAVDFTVVFPKGKLAELELSVDESTGLNGVEKLLKLSTSVSTTNMHMFNADLRLHKYATVDEIIDEFYVIRLATYGKRKEFMLADLRKRLVRLTNRARYIQETLDGLVDLRRKSAGQVSELLASRKFDQIEGDYKYLIKMSMDSVTQENVASILKEKADAEQELARLAAMTLEQMWVGELDVLEREYDVYKRKRETIQLGGSATKANGSGHGTGNGTGTGSAASKPKKIKVISTPAPNK
jgi:DNA topoisomerase-2